MSIESVMPPTISSSIIPFSCLQSFPTSGSFPMSQLFTSGGQSIGTSTSASVLPMNIQDWFPLGWTGWNSLQAKGFSRVFSKTTVQKHQFLMYSFPNFELVHCSMSSSNCCFLICIQITQEACKVVWYSHLFKNFLFSFFEDHVRFYCLLYFFKLYFNFTILYWFCHISKWICHRYICVPHPEPSSLLPSRTIPLGCPQFLVIHTVKGFGIVNKAELDVFLELSCFFYEPVVVGRLISDSSAFSKSNVHIWKFSVHVLLKPGMKDFEHYFASVWDKYNCTVVWTFFGLALLWDWNENWPFPVLWPLLNFPNLLVYWVQHFNSIIFWDLK